MGKGILGGDFGERDAGLGGWLGVGREGGMWGREEERRLWGKGLGEGTVGKGVQGGS